MYYFPDDIWDVIMSHFHSIYKKPCHYEAIMEVSDFYFCTVYHRESYKYGMQWNRSLQVDSYYMRLMLYNNMNTSIINGRYQIKLKRGVASPKIRDDFTNIIKMYKKNSLTNVFNNISYV